ncbi:hypothetical protein G5I_08520 [Acromyrmex echinatior]|uniref:Uncharacterized protein n=1 Tax=Acromyrmex echinatior TaxID=103372 RepID=F4WRR7_ACREC|nr:hypothetical protein G5I_08520 [Acromyrmex echinatior]
MQRKSFRPEETETISITNWRASGRETVTSATITRTASTATPTLQCDVAIPTGNSPCAAETPKGPTRQIFVARSCVSYRRPVVVRHATVSKAVITL